MRISNFKLKLKAKKFTYGELESDIFKEVSKNELIQIEKNFIEQYMLKMQYDTPMGYKYIPMQKFNNNREINEFGYQEHLSNSFFNNYGFFSGSTGWGWGIFSKEQMIDGIISQELNINITNYSNVGVNIYKLYNLINKLKLEKKLFDNNIIYFGINEAYDMSNNRYLYDSMRDNRIKKNLMNFENYYRNIPHNISYILKGLIKNFLQRVGDIKNSYGKKFVDRVPKKSSNIILDEKMYQKNLLILKNIILEINDISKKTIFILEPSLFDKNILTEYEKKLLDKKRMTDNLLESVFDRLYGDLIIFFKNNDIHYIDARDSLKGISNPLYFDYCHPYSNATKIIGKYVSNEILKRL